MWKFTDEIVSINLHFSICSTCTMVKKIPYLRTLGCLSGHPALQVIATATIMHAK
jgi:hypothetical protein